MGELWEWWERIGSEETHGDFWNGESIIAETDDFSMENDEWLMMDDHEHENGRDSEFDSIFAVRTSEEDGGEFAGIS